MFASYHVVNTIWTIKYKFLLVFYIVVKANICLSIVSEMSIKIRLSKDYLGIMLCVSRE